MRLRGAAMTADYGTFLAGKLSLRRHEGIAADLSGLDWLAPFQRDLATWALRKGRAAIFADTGLGKTRVQLAWASRIPGQVLVLAPLSVAQQTASEGTRLGLDVRVVRDGAEVGDAPIAVTNYDRLHRFDASRFVGVVLDESSIIKHHDAKTLGMLLEAFRSTPYRLCATATPAPNDYTELATHAEFLGVCSRAEMLSEYFVHDGGDTSSWRLKGHARREFWRFVASWGALVRRPSDLGYPDDGYLLPPIELHEHRISGSVADAHAAGWLFPTEAQTLSERRTARKSTVDARVQACADIVNAEPDRSWVVWCDLNAESEALTKAIRGAVEIRGAHTAEEKESRLGGFASGDIRVLVSKPSICGFGLNWQHASRMAFVGVTDSWEAYYQAVRRCWRFGQREQVHVHIFASEMEGSVVRNLQRKERDALAMADALAAETAGMVRDEVLGQDRVSNDYNAGQRVTVPDWLTSEEDG